MNKNPNAADRTRMEMRTIIRTKESRIKENAKENENENKDKNQNGNMHENKNKGERQEN